MDNKLNILKVVKIRPFLFLWLGQVTSQIATNMLFFILALRVYQSTGSNTQVSILVLSIALPALLFGMIAGVFVDRWERKLVLVFCNVLRCIAVLGFFLSSETMLWVVLLAVFLSTVTQFFVPAEAPTIPTLVPNGLLLTANSLFTFTFYGSVIIGYILAGPFLRIFGPRNVFVVISLIFFVASVFVRFLPGRSSRRVLLSNTKRLLTVPFYLESFLSKNYIEKILRIKYDLVEGYKFIKSSRKVLTAIALLTFSSAFIAVLAALAPGFADRVLRIDVEDSSTLLMGPAAVGLILGALLAGQYGKRWGKDRMITTGIFLGGVSLLALSFTNRLKGAYNPLFFLDFELLNLAMLLLFFMGMANAFIDVSSNTILQEETTEDVRGRVYGVLTAFIGGASILPVIIAGVFSDLLGVGKVIFTISVVILLFGFYRLRRLR